MARPLRIQYHGAFYHVTSRGNERKQIYSDEGDMPWKGKSAKAQAGSEDSRFQLKTTRPFDSTQGDKMQARIGNRS